MSPVDTRAQKSETLTPRTERDRHPSRPLHICIDARSPGRGGIAIYFANLIDHFPRVFSSYDLMYRRTVYPVAACRYDRWLTATHCEAEMFSERKRISQSRFSTTPFARACLRLPDSIHLVPTGATTGAYHKRLTRLIAKLGIGNRVQFTGEITDELPLLFNLAEAFVLLEAMACGAPIDVGTYYDGHGRMALYPLHYDVPTAP